MLSPSSLNNFISSEKIKNNTKINDDLNFNISVDDFKNVSILYFIEQIVRIVKIQNLQLIN